MITDLISNISLHVIFFEITDYITYVIFYFQVSATALEETKVLVWHRDKLKLTLMETPYLFTVFEHIIARDVVRKLAQVCKLQTVNHGTEGNNQGTPRGVPLVFP